MSLKIGIIGTAGRKEDAAKLTPLVWEKTRVAIRNFIQRFKGEDIHLISGGAAFMDHLAVDLFNHRFAEALTLHFPCGFLNKSDKSLYIESLEIGRIANYYHEQFSKKLGFNSFLQISCALSKGCNFTISKGFKERNCLIANESDVLIALTFGNGKILKDGGTSHTMKLFLERCPPERSFHIDLNNIKLYSPSEVS